MNNKTQINVDLSKSTPVTCENPKCGNWTFQEVVMMFHLSAIVSPTGQEGNVPVPTFACVACGHINEAFLPKFLRNIKDATPETPSTPLISSLKLEK